MKLVPLRLRSITPGTTLAHAVWKIGNSFVRERIHQDEFDLFNSGKHPLKELPKPHKSAQWLLGSGGSPRLNTTNGDSVIGDIWEVLGKVCIRIGDDGDYGYATTNEYGKGWGVKRRGNFLFLDLEDFVGEFPVVTLKRRIPGIHIENGWIRIDSKVSSLLHREFDLGWTPHHSVAYDNSTYGEDLTTGTTLSFSHTTGSGSDRLLIANLLVWSASSGDASATYNSASLTHHWRQDDSWGASAHLEHLFKIAPTTGANTLAITTPLSGNRRCLAYTVTGADQTTGVRTGATAVSPDHSTQISVTVTTVSGDFVVDWLYYFDDPARHANSPQNERYLNNFNTFEYIGLSEKTASGTSTTMSWGGGATYNWMIGATPIIPASGGGGGPTLAMLGDQYNRRRTG